MESEGLRRRLLGHWQAAKVYFKPSASNPTPSLLFVSDFERRFLSEADRAMDCIDLVGEIMYVEGGQMTAVLACKNRGGDKQDVLRHFPDDHPKAFLYHGTNHTSERYSILTQYSGSFTVDDAQGSVTHTIGTSFHPRYVGKTLMRQAKFDVRERLFVGAVFSEKRSYF